jgi:FkbM family methyltransferase
MPIPVLRGPLRGLWFIHHAASGPAGGASVHFGLSESRQTAWIASKLARGHVFYDIGANVGHYTLLASRIVGEGGAVIAVEPLPRNILYLKRHLDLNRIWNVLVVEEACSGSERMGLFGQHQDPALGRLIDSGTGNARASFSVHVTTVDHLMRRGGRPPDLIKIDVEGEEHAVLEGAKETIRAAAPSFALSFHSDDLRARCISLLKSLGYEVFPLDAESEELAAEFAAVPRRD